MWLNNKNKPFVGSPVDDRETYRKIYEWCEEKIKQGEYEEIGSGDTIDIESVEVNITKEEGGYHISLLWGIIGEGGQVEKVHETTDVENTEVDLLYLEAWLHNILM